ncbi:GlxA family transcriptional regulator [Kiloniella antarctica]|uniref:GlxA family transcriptional regulator n=1 Tax=Kiloniella antarctica TaxID=1550907 RepID=A0ABW5BS43_9PROT
MIRKAPQELPQRVVFFLVPKFSLIAFTSAIEPLRLANRESGKKLYSWNLVSADDQPVMSSCGIPISPTMNFDDPHSFHTAIICSGEDAHKNTDKRIHSWLRRVERMGTDIGALCTGAHILAKAGLLDDYSCTIHWENLEGFIEDFPEIEVTPELFEIDRNRFTCAGGTASLDMMLNVISSQHGHELAAEVANQFMHDRIRDQHDQQRMSMPVRLGVRHPKLLAVIKLMEDNLEEPLTRIQLARDAGLSTRQLERLFRKYLSRSPARYYLELRLNKARLLLLQTNMSVIDVALACGFVSASHFSKCYRDFFGRTPRKERGLPALSDGETEE